MAGGSSGKRRAAVLLATLVLSGCAAAPRPRAAAVRPSQHTHPPVNGQLLVTLPADGPWSATLGGLTSRHAVEVVASWPMLSLGLRCALLQAVDTHPAAALLRSLSSDPRVDSAQANQVFTVRQQTGEGAGWDDRYLDLQYAARSLGLPEAHRWATGRGVEIALVDTGVDVTHPDLEDRVAIARNFVRQDSDEFTGDRHGTAVAGVIAAVAGNGHGIVGVAPEAKLRALKACWYGYGREREAVCTSYTLAQALDYAIAERVPIINLSLAGPHDPLLERLLRRAVDVGLLVVAAAGPEPGRFPASVPGIVAVRASDAHGRPFPPVADGGEARGLIAPGAEILTLVPEASYDFLSGSSLAAAHVSGVAALLLQRQPGLDPAAIARLLTESAVPTADGPAVNACSALGRIVGEPCTAPQAAAGSAP